MFKKLFSKLLGNDKFCMYCNECGTYNPDVFIKVNDVELGPGWLCKNCFIEETEEEFLCLKEQIKLYRKALKDIKKKLKKTTSYSDTDRTTKTCIELQEFIDNVLAEYED